MRNLTIPCMEPHKILDDIIANKQGERFEQLNSSSSLLHECFDEYEASKHSLENIREKIWATLEKKNLHYCYNEGGKPLEELKWQIKNAQHAGLRRYCPYCLLDTVSSFDHYLPKEIFPEYSVYGFNLVPCCSLCNGKKSSKFLKSGKRQFINLYYDNIPQENFLHVKIVVMNGNLMAEYYLDPSVSDLIREHFNNLNLLIRFAEAAPEVFSEVKNTMSQFKSTSLKDAQSFMSQNVRIWEETYSKNYWKVILYEYLLAEPSILQVLYT